MHYRCGFLPGNLLHSLLVYESNCELSTPFEGIKPFFNSIVLLNCI